MQALAAQPWLVPATYGLYLTISVGVTVWVARTLHKNGRTFLVDAMHGDDDLADSINHLLVVGFYLVNIGFVSLFLRMTDKPQGTAEAIEALSHKVGVVLLVLGAMHFLNIVVFNKWRTHARLIGSPPPIAPTETTAPAPL